MNINTITAEDLRRMPDKEGLILQGCGGDLTEWVDGINEMLTKAGILKDGCQFENVAAFQHGELTCLLYPFDDVKLDIGKLALWRLQTHEVYGGTWLSDFVPNYLGGFIETPEALADKPDCPLIGADGNIFNLLGIASRTLREHGLKEQAKEMSDRVFVSGSYGEALCIIGEYVNITDSELEHVYCDAQMMEIAKAQMNLLEGRVPEKANEVVVSEYFLSTYGNNAKIGDTVTLDTESFHGDYIVTGIMDSVNEKEANTCAIILSKAALTEWNKFDPAGYRAYVHFKNSDQLGEELITSYCREIAEEYQLPMPKMNSKYFAYASKSFDFALMAGVIALVLIGGYIVIQSIFRISINDKIQSYGQLRTIGATPKQIKRIVKNEGRKLGNIGILIGTVLGVCGGFLLFPKGFNAVSYVATVILTLTYKFRIQ